jgi:hypothetical protein
MKIMDSVNALIERRNKFLNEKNEKESDGEESLSDSENKTENDVQELDDDGSLDKSDDNTAESPQNEQNNDEIIEIKSQENQSEKTSIYSNKIINDENGINSSRLLLTNMDSKEVFSHNSVADKKRPLIEVIETKTEEEEGEEEEEKEEEIITKISSSKIIENIEKVSMIDEDSDAISKLIEPLTMKDELKDFKNIESSYDELD